MISFTVTTFIDRPQQEVFDFMSDPANFAQWQSGTESGGWASEGPVAVGSISHVEARMLGRKLVMDSEITQWEPPSSWGMKGSSGPMSFENTNRFEPKDGDTLLTRDFSGEVGGFLKMAEGVALKKLKKSVEGDSKALKTLLEAK